MVVETLVVTTNQSDDHLPERMNIQTDALIGNQCGRNEFRQFEHRGKRITYISTDQRGVGLNRNQVLMRASGDLCVFADDDMVFLDGYETAVIKWFEMLPKADVLIFNLQGGKKRRVNESVLRINPFNYGKYGAARIAFRTEAVRFSGVTFHTMFGGGCEYSCGEDSLFLAECLRKGLRIYAVPDAIAKINDEKSSWFSGFHDKYFRDKGVLYYKLNRRICGVTALYHCFKNRKKYKGYGWLRGYREMIKGIRSVK